MIRSAVPALGPRCARRRGRARTCSAAARPDRQATTPASAHSSAKREVLAVGFLPVTCHLTCPVTDFASKTSPSTRFESQRFTDFPTVVETMKSGRLDATFMIAPLAMKLREQGVKVKIVVSRSPRRIDGDGAQGPARAAASKDLEGPRVRDPEQVQQPEPGHPQADEGPGRGDPATIRFVEMPPPDMPGRARHARRSTPTSSASRTPRAPSSTARAACSITPRTSGRTSSPACSSSPSG